MSAGAEFGVVRGGYYAIESLRLEKGYRAFGRELTPNDSPVEAGLLFACKLKTDIGFVGREAVEKAKAAGPRRRLLGFSVDDPEAMLWGGELVLRDGVAAGQVSSAAWGETTGACVGLAYVRSPDAAPVTADWVKAGRYEVNVGGQLYPITVSLKAIYDPGNSRIR
jgi:4-methylaminobutanoate oxidase (formaldehyde-forming)